MTTMQEKTTKAVVAAAEAAGFEVVTEASYSNCGVWHFQPADGFDTALTVRYMFAASQSCFEAFDPEQRRGASGNVPVWPQRPGTDDGSNPNMFIPKTPADFGYVAEGIAAHLSKVPA